MELVNVILICTQVKVVCHLSHSLLDFCILLIFGKYFEVIDGPLKCLLPVVIHILLGDINPSPNKVLDAVIDVLILPFL